MRAPSSFQSTAAGRDLRQRGGDVRGGAREHRRERAADLQPDAASPSRPSVSATAATAARSPCSISARRTAVAGTSGRLGDRVGHHAGERALAQLAADQPDEERLLVLGRAGEQLGDRRPPRGDEPGAASAPIAVNVASTSATVSVAAAAGSGRSRSSAQPTPICRWVSSPESQRTTGATSSGPACRSSSASAAIFALRAGRRRDRGGGVDQLGELHAARSCRRSAARGSDRRPGRPGCRSRRRSRRGARTR